MTRHRAKKTLFQLMSTGDRIHWLLQLRNLSQTELSLVADVSQPTIANLMSNPKRKPNAHTLLSLAAALSCDPRFLLYGTNEPHAADQVRTHQERALLAMFDKLNEQSRNQILVLASLLSNPGALQGKSSKRTRTT